MVFIIWEVFTAEWLKRARRRGKGIDDGDKFICLWIAFNGWMRGRFGEGLKDWEQIEKVKDHREIRQTFCHLEQESPSFSRRLNELCKYTVENAKFPGDQTRYVTYDGRFETLIDVLYSVRCNLFHGRKAIEERGKDFELVSLSYRILLRLFVVYLKEYESSYKNRY